MRIYDFVEDSRCAGIAMEFVDGRTLTSLKLEQPDGCFSVETLRPWAQQLCEALEYAHAEAKVAHRDLKPANLMVDGRGGLKIADFGISATLTDTATRASRQVSSSGTPVYMSPQQMMGEKPAVTDDIYSLGATLYELLTGKLPFYSGNVCEWCLDFLGALSWRKCVRSCRHVFGYVPRRPRRQLGRRCQTLPLCPPPRLRAGLPCQRPRFPSRPQFRPVSSGPAASARRAEQ